jgi:hypothetical protein
MAGRTDPSAMRKLVGNELRHYRIRAGQTTTAAAKHLKCSQTKITHMETGKYTSHPDDLVRLLRFYGVEEHEIARLASLAGQVNAPIWWAPWSAVLPDWFRTFVGLEGMATSEFVYNPAFVPGILQSEEYARELTQAAAFVREDHAERFASFRVARAKRLTDDDPIRVHAVISEAGLRLHVGTPEIRKAQWEYLVSLTELPNVTIQVARPEDGPQAASTGQFYLLDFAQARPIGYAELIDGAVYIQDEDELAPYKIKAGKLCRAALQPGESAAYIKSLVTAG